MSEKEDEMYGTVSWNGEINGKAAVITSYKKGSSLWLFEKKWFRRGKWVRIQYITREEAMAAAGAQE
jgi:hypothetical protein